MVDTIMCLIILGVLILLGFMFYSFLLKTKKGRTKIKWKLALYKILQIEFESEHSENLKKHD